MRGLEREKKDKEKSQFVQPAKRKQKKKITRKCHTVFCAVFQRINSKMQINLFY